MTTRLGGLAANLARIKSFADNPDHGDAVRSLVEESEHFVEWAAPDADLDAQEQLVELQLQLARWHHRWAQIWYDESLRTDVARRAEEWSGRVLGLSGLLS